MACFDACLDSVEPVCLGETWACPPEDDTMACPGCGSNEGLSCSDECGLPYELTCIDDEWVCDPPTGLTCPPTADKPALWSDSFGTEEYSSARDVIIDGEGNVYVAARYRTTLTLDPDVTVPSSGGYDTVVTKYDPEGNRLWFQTLGGAGDELPHGLELDPSGELVLLLSSSDVNTGNPPKAGPSSLVWLGSEDGAVLDELLLGFELTLSDDDLLARGADGTLYVAGHFEGTLSWLGPALTANGDGEEILLAALDPAGSVSWARSLGGPSHDNVVAIDVDDAGNLFLTGAFRSAMTVDGITLSPQADFDGFVMSFDATTGQAQWGQPLHSSLDATGGDVRAYGDGGVVITGTFYGGATLDGAALQASSEQPEAFLARLDAQGDLVFSQVRGPARAGGSLNVRNGWHADVDPSGDVLLVGSLYVANSNTDTLLARHGPVDGALRWETVYDEGSVNDVHGVHARDGLIAITGQMFGTADFGNGNLQSYPKGASFVALFTTAAPPD